MLTQQTSSLGLRGASVVLVVSLRSLVWRDAGGGSG